LEKLGTTYLTAMKAKYNYISQAKHGYLLEKHGVFNEFQHLKGRCFEKELNGYHYKLCWFGSVT
jgi:hypothetical protein